MDAGFAITLEWLANRRTRATAVVVSGAQAPGRGHARLARSRLRRADGLAAAIDEAPTTGRCSRAAPRPTSATTRSSSSRTASRCTAGIGVTWEHDLHLFLRRATAALGPRRDPCRPLRADHHAPREGVTVSDTPAAPGAESLDAFRLQCGSGCAPTCDRSPSSRRGARPATIPRSSRGRAWCSACCSTRVLPGSSFPASTAVRACRPSTSAPYAEEAKDYEQAFIFQEPTLNILAPTLLDSGRRSRSAGTCPRSSAATSGGCSSSPSRRAGPTSPSTMTAPAGRRRLGPQRIEDLERRRRSFRLGDVPGAHQLGRAEAPRADDVPRADPTARYRSAPHPDGRRQRDFCQEFLTDVFVADDDVSATSTAVGP